MAARAGALEREEALGVADAALARTGWAGLGPRAGLGARARAGFAGHRGRDAHVCGLAAVSLLEADLHVVAQVRATLAAGAAAASRPRAAHAEQVVEDVREGRGDVPEAARRAARAAMLECGMAEAVIGRALLAIGEDLIGLVDLLEPPLARLVAGIAIGVPLHGKLAERRLQLAVDDGALDLKHFVIATLGHPRVPPRGVCRIEPYPVIHGDSKP